MDKKKHIVIIGGGVIGCCCAYYLSQNGGDHVEIIVLERESIACSASGKAGGFLARDWCDHDVNLNELARKSFQLHHDLAKQLNGKDNYEFRELDTYSVDIDLSKYPNDPSSYKLHEKSCVKVDKQDWLNGCGINSKNPNQFKEIGNENNTCQVEPYLFTNYMIKKAINNNNTIVKEGQNVIGLEFNDNNQIKSIIIEDNDNITNIDHVIIAIGPWTPRISSWISNITGKQFAKSLKKQFFPEKFYSIIIEPKIQENKDKISPIALFTKNNSAIIKLSEPEIYPRPSGKVYVCGCEEVIAIPDNPAEVLPSIDEHCKTLASVAANISSLLRVDEYFPNDSNASICKKQACYLPNTKKGLPLLGPLPNCKNTWLAAGNGCWGILTGPISGKIISEYILDNTVTIMKADAFNPKYYFE